MLGAHLSGTADGFSKAVTKYRSPPVPAGGLPPPGAMKSLTVVMGQAPGNVIALIWNGRVVDSAHFVEGEAGPLPPAAPLGVCGASAWRLRGVGSASAGRLLGVCGASAGRLLGVCGASAGRLLRVCRAFAGLFCAVRRPDSALSPLARCPLVPPTVTLSVPASSAVPHL